MSHSPTADIRHCCKHIVLATIDLLLVMVECMDRAWADVIQRDVDWRHVDPKWLIRHSRKSRVRLSTISKYGQVGKYRSVVIYLCLLFGGGVRHAVGSRK